MIHLHATRKLFDRLPLSDAGQLAVTPRSQWLFEQPVLDINPLSGWHGNLVTLQRRQCVLLVHDATRFPLVLPALSKPDFAELNDRFVDVLMNTLLKVGAEEAQMNAAQKYLRPLQVEIGCNRSALGTLNQMKFEIECYVAHDGVNIAEMTGYRLGAWLADTPRSVKGRGYLWPNKEMLSLLAGLANNNGKTEAANDD
jgi:hypothetical protein